MSAALLGVRVLDFSHVLAGPFASMTLADMGADVVKIEHPDRPDLTRSFGPPFVDGISAYFLSVNRGKRSVALDLKQSSGLKTAQQLATVSDVVLHNFRPGVMARLGLDSESLREHHPKLIHCGISGFGAHDSRPAYDLVVQGMGGIASLTGPPNGQPYKVGTSMADLVAGQSAVQAILAALIRRDREGIGATIDVPMIDGQRAMLTYRASNWLNAGVMPQRTGNHHRSLFPYGTYPTSDGFINLAVADDSAWRAFCDVAGLQGLGSDPQYATNPARVQHRTELEPTIVDVMTKRTRAEWMDVLTEVGVIVGPILTVPEALEDAPLVSHPHPEGKTQVRSVPLPFVMDAAPRAAVRGAPSLGEHTAEVCLEWLRQ